MFALRDVKGQVDTVRNELEVIAFAFISINTTPGNTSWTILILIKLNLQKTSVWDKRRIEVCGLEEFPDDADLGVMRAVHYILGMIQFVKSLMSQELSIMPVLFHLEAICSDLLGLG